MTPESQAREAGFFLFVIITVVFCILAQFLPILFRNILVAISILGLFGGMIWLFSHD
jgi:hypothetical protein